MRRLFACATLLLLGSCVTPSPAPVPNSSPVYTPPQAPITRPAPVQTTPKPYIIPTTPSQNAAPNSKYAYLTGWSSAKLAPSLKAFERSCALLNNRAQSAYLSDKAPWVGTVADWTPACAATQVVGDEASARTVLEALFVPVEIVAPDNKSRFTGYFEPSYQARRIAVPPYTEPVPALPVDLEQGPNGPVQRLRNGTTRPYPTRQQITARGVTPLAYAHPADVFFLQIQGSGRLTFPDGSTMRAAYAAHNGQKFASTANWLIQRGWITRGEASMQGIRAWMDRASPSRVREAMNANPRFVFFQAKPEGDPALGPDGAQGVPLTPLGSIAVDTDIHALGVPMFIQTTAPGLGGDWSGLMISQDTGGAIKGTVRGDLYFGTGTAAGERAGTMNAPGKMWVLLPRAVANRLPTGETAMASIRLQKLASAP